MAYTLMAYLRKKIGHHWQGGRKKNLFLYSHDGQPKPIFVDNLYSIAEVMSPSLRQIVLQYPLIINV